VTANSEPLTERALTGDDVAAGLLLSTEAHWNQVAADWRIMLEAGTGFGWIEPGGRLVASALTLPFDGPFGWISMVLVTAAYRRKGLATRLMQRCLDHLAANERIPVLDATPAGRTVYLGLGFTDLWGLARWTGHGPVAEQGACSVREIEARDWPQILALDLRCFGGGRARLLRDLAARQPKTALVIPREGAVRGFALGREGRVAGQIGPIVAEDESAACALLAAALARHEGEVFVDVPDRWRGMRGMLTERGFRIQRPYTRMRLGAGSGWGDPALMFAVAGPELG
jgi:GNAT superfamily N-acetyltransferase